MSEEAQARVVLAARLFALSIPRAASTLGRKPTPEEKMRLHAASEEEAWALPGGDLDESSPAAQAALGRVVGRVAPP